MPLTFPTPPADAFATLVSGLQSIAATQQGPLGSGSLALAAAPSVVRPHPVYTLDLDDLAAGKGLEAARIIAWRYLIVDNQQVRQAAEVLPGQGGGASRFGSLTDGFVAGSEQAFGLAESLPEVHTRPYEIRVLRIPPLYVVALWLKDVNGTEDRFVVLPPVRPPLQALSVYAASELLTVLRQKAAHKLPMEQKGTTPIIAQKPRP